MYYLTSAPQQSVLILTGMHRSGTSLTASLLQSAGLDIGEKLMPGNISNIKGHFEDLEFVRFHENVLRSQGFSKEGWILQETISVQEQYLERAKKLICDRQNKSFWGWKDPRTTLFLDFWAKLIPEAKFLFVYRSPWEVIDSLYRRGGNSDDVFINNPNFALALWMNYNKAILHFYDHFYEKCILLNLSSIIYDPNYLIEKVEKKLGISLNQPKNLYDKSLLNHQDSNSHRPSLLKHYFPEVLGLYYELSTRDEFINRQFGAFLAEESTRFSSDRAWVLQDWLEIRQLERVVKQSKTQLHQIQSQLLRSQSQLYQTQSQVIRSQIKLSQTQSQLAQSQGNLAQAQSQLAQSQENLTQTQFDLQQIHHYLKQLQQKWESDRALLQEIQQKWESDRALLQEIQQKWESDRALLQEIQQKWQESQRQLQHHQQKLQQSQEQQHYLQLNFQQTQAQLARSQSELQQTYQQLQKAQAEKQDLEERIRAMETSKFWKLRRIWVKLKSYF